MASSVTGPNMSYNATNVNSSSSNKSGTLGKDDFLKILVTQLKNQDPMEPLQDREFIAQMAQFTSVEQLMNISEQVQLFNQSLGAASSIIGKFVQWNEIDNSGAVVAKSGTVESILLKDGVQYATTENGEVPIDQLISIGSNVQDTDRASEAKVVEGESSEEGSATSL